MPRSIVLVVLLGAVVAASGCVSVGPDSDLDAPTETPEGVLNTAFGAAYAATNLTLEDWYLLASPLSSQGHLAGFAWDVPAGAVQADPDIAGSKAVALEAAPVVTLEGVSDSNAEGARVDALAAAFLLHDGKAILLHDVLMPTILLQSTKPLVGTAMVPVTSAQTFFFRLSHPEIDDGDRIVFLLAGYGNLAGELGLFLRLLDHVPGYDASSSPDADAFLGHVEGAPIALRIVGQGEGLQLGIYFLLNALTQGGIEGWSDGVDVERLSPAPTNPTATADQLIIRSKPMGTRGWSASGSLYYTAAGAGHWEVDANLRGTQFAARSPFLFAPEIATGTTPTADVLGWPGHWAILNGDGESQTDFRVATASLDLVELLIFVQEDLGERLEVLTGAPSDPVTMSGAGMLGNVPPSSIHVDEDSIRILYGQGPARTIIGWTGLA